jgi:hypothetical protein
MERGKQRGCGASVTGGERNNRAGAELRVESEHSANVCLKKLARVTSQRQYHVCDCL